MTAAAEVQALLLSARVLSGSDYAIDPVYLPASEVGGDFYQIVEREDGCRLVLLGDAFSLAAKESIPDTLLRH